MSLEIIEKNESAVRGYSRAFPAVFTSARGSIIQDETGKVYIDFFSGAGGLNYGHNHPAIKQAMVDYLQKDGIIHGLDMATEAKIAFIDSFQKHVLQPKKLGYKLQFTGPTGTNAVEAALKLARLVTKRTRIISFTHAFHGVSVGALAATSNNWFRDAAGVELSNVTFLPYEGYVEGLDSIAYFEKLLDDPSSGLTLPAAVIVEAIQGEGGINVASADWLQRLRKLTAKKSILLIVDDIQAGCGRTGDFFSFEEAGIVPDIVTLSKSISASGLPMALLLIKSEYDIWKPGQHNGTFRGNNLAFVSAEAAIREFWCDDTFAKEIRRKGQLMRDRLQVLTETFDGLDLSIRGRGMFYGIDFNKDIAQAKEVAQHAFANGLVVELAGGSDEVVKLLPALTIDDKTLLQGIDIIDKSIKASSRWT